MTTIIPRQPERKPERITVCFECHGCGARAQVDCPEKARAVDIKYWMDTIVAGRITQAHAIISPLCQAATFNLAIPLAINPETGDVENVGKSPKDFNSTPSDLGIFDKLAEDLKGEMPEPLDLTDLDKG